jgi:hypothetical protein
MPIRLIDCLRPIMCASSSRNIQARRRVLSAHLLPHRYRDDINDRPDRGLRAYRRGETAAISGLFDQELFITRYFRSRLELLRERNIPVQWLRARAALIGIRILVRLRDWRRVPFPCKYLTLRSIKAHGQVERFFWRRKPICFLVCAWNSVLEIKVERIRLRWVLQRRA